MNQAMSPHPGPPPPFQPPPQHPVDLPWFRRTWLLLIVTGVVALLIGVAAGQSGNSKATADANSTVTATATSTTTSTSIVTLMPTATNTVTITPIKTIATRTRTKIRTETYTPPPKPSFDDGTYEVGTDIKPGKFRTSGGGDCYYAILKDVSGGLDSIVSNNNFSGPSIVKLNDGQYFEVSGGCEWRHA